MAIRSSKAALVGAALPELTTGFAGNDSAVSVSDYTMDPQVHSIWKTHIVDLLSDLFELEPASAIAWAHAIQARYFWFRGA